MRYLAEFDALPDGAKVLELGCCAGVPCGRKFAERHDVLGVDLAREQVEPPRANVPEARFEKGDMTVLDLPEGEFDGIAAFYVPSNRYSSRGG